MRELREKVKLFGTKGSQEVKALFDTGSTWGYMDKKVADKVGLIIYDRQYDVELPNKTKTKMKPAIGEIEVNGCRMPIITLVAENPLSEMVLGMVQMETMGIKIDPRKGYTISCPIPRA